MRRCLGCMEEYSKNYDICPYCGYEVNSPPREAYHMVPGTLLGGRYTIGQVLGFGGFGVTYIGYDTVLNRKVAIKEYLPSEFSTRIPGQTEITTYEGERTEQFQSGLGKFLEEAKILAKMQATNGVVQIYNSFQENQTAYIVMEYLEGKTLKTYLSEVEKLSVDEAKDILHPILIALKDVHEQGIIHRDIAPDNIFLTNDGRVKLLDFGASRFATTSHSKSLSVIIKQGYAPIEQYRSRGDQGPWTDVYSLAATFYKMITGVTPEDSMERVEKEDLKAPSKLGVDIPKNVENALMNALNIKFEDRTQNIEIFEREMYVEDKVKLRFVHLKKADVGKWPLWTKITVAAAVFAVCIFAGLLATGVIDYSRFIPESFALPEGMTRVPNLVNNEIALAEKMSDDAQLIIQIVDKQYSEYIPQDMVLTQNLNKGKILEVDNIVEVVISAGMEKFFMQDVCGYSNEMAMEILMGLGLVVEMEETFSAYAPGAIVKQSIKPNDETYRGASIVVTRSKGYDTYVDTTQEVTVPDFTGMTLDEALKEASKCGLYLVRGNGKEGREAVGSIYEQNVKAFTKAKQGDIIEICVVEEQVKVYMPDVQYKDISEAIRQLESLGVKVKTEYVDSETVAKDKVISQSVAAGTLLGTNVSVKLTVSQGTEEINQIVASNPWSAWETSLPADYNVFNYDLETKTQYSFRDKSTMESYEANLSGWTLYDQTTKKGEYGPWSAWSTTHPGENADRQIEQKTQYAYSNYLEKTQVDDSSMPGWTLKGEKSYYADDYGDWSEWSVGASYATSDTRKVQTQYRSQTKQTTTSTASKTMSGWEYVNSTPGAACEFSDWTRNVLTESFTENYEIRVEIRNVNVDKVYSHTNYNYGYIKYRTNGGDILYTPYNSWWEDYCQRAGTILEKKGPITFTYQLPFSHYSSDAGENVYHDNTSSGIAYYYWNKEDIYIDVPYPEYRTYKVPYTHHFYKWSDWSGWGDSAISSNANTKVETRSRYADKKLHKEYTFYQWTGYGAFSDTRQSTSATCKETSQVVYQYRDKTNVPYYFYYKWGDWSEYRDEKVEKSDSREVQTRTLYRYRKK